MAFDGLLARLSHKYERVIITGHKDLNIDKPVSNSKCKIIKDLLENSNTKSLVNEPTRVPSSCASALDYTVTNKELSVVLCAVFELGLSDHKA